MWRLSLLCKLGLVIDKEHNGLNKKKGQLCTMLVDEELIY